MLLILLCCDMGHHRRLVSQTIGESVFYRRLVTGIGRDDELSPTIHVTNWR